MSMLEKQNKNESDIEIFIEIQIAFFGLVPGAMVEVTEPAKTMQVMNFKTMQVMNFETMQVMNFETMQVMNFETMQVMNFETMQVMNCL